ncbi:MAG: hypothetical protein ABIY51_01310 [Ferruginibacter sp.]
MKTLRFYYIDTKVHTLLLAQGVEKAANELNYKFDGLQKSANSKDHYSLAYSQFIMPLVKVCRSSTY